VTIKKKGLRSALVDHATLCLSRDPFNGHERLQSTPIARPRGKSCLGRGNFITA
jgi:hypothetical protein